MWVCNVHERRLAADPSQVSGLIDSLAGQDDRLWPSHLWPRMKFDRPLRAGAEGGHGPIRYFVDEYRPGQSVKFRFTRPAGFDGFHGYDVLLNPGRPAVLRHTLVMRTRGAALLLWPVVFRPLHDALIEDSLEKAENSLGLSFEPKAWSLRVRILRWILSAGRAASKGRPAGGVAGTP